MATETSTRTYVNYIREDGVAVLTINNPPMNVLSAGVSRDLSDCMRELQADESVRVLVLTGAGEKAFMAGADIKEFPELTQEGAAKASSKRIHAVLDQIQNYPGPTIAAINGYALGGGCELAIAFDLRVAAAGVKIGVPEVNLGILCGGGGTQRLPRLLGTSRALELMFTGDPITAEEAHRIGLVNVLAPAGQALPVAMELAKKLAAKPGMSLKLIKKAVYKGIELPLKDGLDLEADCFQEAFHTEDHREGIQAFIEKRAGRFQHR